MQNIRTDSRVVSFVSRPGIKNLLLTILEQLQRCQKALNEFLEVSRFMHSISAVHTCVSVGGFVQHTPVSNSVMLLCTMRVISRHAYFAVQHCSRNSTAMLRTTYGKPLPPPPPPGV